MESYSHLNITLERVKFFAKVKGGADFSFSKINSTRPEFEILKRINNV